MKLESKYCFQSLLSKDLKGLSCSKLQPAWSLKSPWDEKTRIVRNEEKKNELALTKDGKKDFFFLAKSPTIYLCKHCCKN